MASAAFKNVPQTATTIFAFSSVRFLTKRTSPWGQIRPKYLSHEMPTIEYPVTVLSDLWKQVSSDIGCSESIVYWNSLPGGKFIESYTEHNVLFSLANTTNNWATIFLICNIICTFRYCLNIMKYLTNTKTVLIKVHPHWNLFKQLITIFFIFIYKSVLQHSLNWLKWGSTL